MMRPDVAKYSERAKTLVDLLSALLAVALSLPLLPMPPVECGFAVSVIDSVRVQFQFRNLSP